VNGQLVNLLIGQFVAGCCMLGAGCWVLVTGQLVNSSIGPYFPLLLHWSGCWFIVAGFRRLDFSLKRLGGSKRTLKNPTDLKMKAFRCSFYTS